jgi:hypothetical protein
MTSTYNYDDTLKKSVISGKDFNSNKTPQQIEEKLIPCTDIKKFTVDTLLYLHIYNGLYLSLLNYNQTNNKNIQKFDMFVKNLTIVIDKTTSNPNMYVFDTENFTYTFYLENFKVNYKSESNTGYTNYTNSDNNNDINENKPLLTNVNTLTGSSLDILSDTEINQDLSFNKTTIAELLKTSNKNKNQYYDSLKSPLTRLNKLKIIIFDILYTNTENIETFLKYYTNYYHLILYNISIQVSLRTFYLNAIDSSSTYTITNAKFGSGAIINASGIKIIHKYTNFSIASGAGGSGFQVDDVIELNTANGDLTPKASATVATVESGAITGLKNIIHGYSSSYDGTGSATYTYKRKGAVITPTAPTITLTKDTINNYIYIPLTNKGSSYYIDPTITINNKYTSTGNITHIFDIDKRDTYSINYIIGQSTGTFTINISGTPTIEAFNQYSYSFNTYNSLTEITYNDLEKILFAIEDNIHNMNNNINGLIYRFNNGKPDLIDEYTPIKRDMIKTITDINDKKDEKKKYQDDVNYKIRLYNDHTKNFKHIKKYANYVIYFLIFVIALTLILSIIPTVSSNVKFTYYIITIILLFIFTFLYYTNFKDIHYENEKFTDYTSSIITASPSSGTCLTSVITYNDRNQEDRDKHAKLINRLAITLTNYYKTYNYYTQTYRTFLTSFGSDVFTKDNNELLYEIYLTNVKQIDLFKIKKVELANSIEIIKRQIIYLFNVILFISLFTIILILALLLYTIVPTMMISIISLCVILLIIVITYFTVVLSYPTRMIADKNYWAIHNPSKYTLAKIS